MSPPKVCMICPLRSQSFLTALRRVLLQAFTHLHPPHPPSSMQCSFLARRPVFSSQCPVHHLGWVAQATKAITLQCPLPVCTEVCHILQINPPVSPRSLNSTFRHKIIMHRQTKQGCNRRGVDGKYAMQCSSPVNLAV